MQPLQNIERELYWKLSNKATTLIHVSHLEYGKQAITSGASNLTVMQFNIITLFPEMFGDPFNASILKRAQEKSLIKIELHNLRDYCKDKHRVTDDLPYGGGVGMVMKPEPLITAIEAIKTLQPEVRTLLMRRPRRLLSSTWRPVRLGCSPSLLSRSALAVRPPPVIRFCVTVISAV